MHATSMNISLAETDLREPKPPDIRRSSSIVCVSTRNTEAPSR